MQFLPQEYFLEVFFRRKTMKNKKLRIMLYLTILSVISFLLMYIMEVPILSLVGMPGFEFLKYDLSEVIGVVAGFIFGPVAGMIVIGLKSILFFFSGKNTTGWVGLAASLTAGLALVAGATILYRLKQKRVNLFIGVIIGTLALTVLMLVFNYFIFLPLYGIEANTFWITGLAAFNILKGLLSGIFSVILYELLKKRVETFLNK